MRETANLSVSCPDGTKKRERRKTKRPPAPPFSLCLSSLSSALLVTWLSLSNLFTVARAFLHPQPPLPRSISSFKQRPIPNFQSFFLPTPPFAHTALLGSPSEEDQKHYDYYSTDLSQPKSNKEFLDRLLSPKQKALLAELRQVADVEGNDSAQARTLGKQIMEETSHVPRHLKDIWNTQFRLLDIAAMQEDGELNSKQFEEAVQEMREVELVRVVNSLDLEAREIIEGWDKLGYDERRELRWKYLDFMELSVRAFQIREGEQFVQEFGCRPVQLDVIPLIRPEPEEGRKEDEILDWLREYRKWVLKRRPVLRTLWRRWGRQVKDEKEEFQREFPLSLVKEGNRSAADEMRDGDLALQREQIQRRDAAMDLMNFPFKKDEDLTVPQEAVPAGPDVIIMDFDGLFFDSQKEFCEATWRAAAILWPDWFSERFGDGDGGMPWWISSRVRWSRFISEFGYEGVFALRWLSEEIMAVEKKLGTTIEERGGAPFPWRVDFLKSHWRRRSFREELRQKYGTSTFDAMNAFEQAKEEMQRDRGRARQRGIAEEEDDDWEAKLVPTPFEVVEYLTKVFRKDVHLITSRSLAETIQILNRGELQVRKKDPRPPYRPGKPNRKGPPNLSVEFPDGKIRIYRARSFSDKVDIIDFVTRKFRRKPNVPVHVFDDRIEPLVAMANDRRDTLRNARLNFVLWGNSDPSQKELALDHPRIRGVTSADFLNICVSAQDDAGRRIQTGYQFDRKEGIRLTDQKRMGTT